MAKAKISKRTNKKTATKKTKKTKAKVKKTTTRKTSELARDTATLFYDVKTGKTLKRKTALKKKNAKVIVTDKKGKAIIKADGTPRLSTSFNGRPEGKKWKLGIVKTWARLFDENETRKKPRTDAEISKFMHAEFPGRNSLVFDRVTLVRSRYNRGVLTNGKLPKKQSTRKG